MIAAEESHHHERKAEEDGGSPQAGEHPAASPDRKTSRRPFKAVDFVENKLVSVVEECLREATHKSQRKEILQNLFVDLSQKIEPQYRGTINASSQSPYQYYYELIADYYVRHPSAALDLQSVCQELIFNFHFPAIFALIFHKWLFSSTHPNLTLSRYNVFLKGANRLFWNDLENKEFTYRRIYKFLKYDVALNKYVDQMFLKVLATVHEYSSLNSDNESSSEAENMIQEHQQMEGESEHYITSLFLTKKLDLIGIIGKYFFFYELQTGKKYFHTYVQLLAEKHSEHLFPKVTDVSQLDSTVKMDMQTENTTEEQKEKVLQMITDLFVQENILLLSSIHSEETLLELLEDFKYFAESKMSSKMRVKLQATLYSMSCPGGPAYPTRNIRHKAKEVTDTLFPNGKMARFMINTGFRVLHQYTWPRSLWHYVTQQFWGLLSLPFSVLAWVRKIFQFSPMVTEEMGKNESKKHAS